MNTIDIHIKQEIRRLALSARDAMSEEERISASQRICERAEYALGDAAGLHVAVYASMNSEVDISPLIQWLYQHDAQVAFPCMNKKGITPRMHMRNVSFDAWSSHSVPFIEKPIKRFEESDAALDGFPIVDSADINAIIVPMVAFDSSFNRLGYGGGNYDEYLGLVSRETTVIGVAFETQHVPHIPTEPHDMPLPCIVSA